MTMLSCSEAIKQLGGSALTFSVSSVAAAVEIEVCARTASSRLAQGGRMGADGRSCVSAYPSDNAEVLSDAMSGLCHEMEAAAEI